MPTDIDKCWEGLVDQLYENRIKPGVGNAKTALKSSAPNIRDIKSQTYAYLADESNENVATIVFVSDSKQPDVLKVTGNRQRQIGRPPGSKNGVNNQTVKYSSGVDMSNVTNGVIQRKAVGFPTQKRTGRAKPMPTEGWWIKGLKSAVKAFCK